MSKSRIFYCFLGLILISGVFGGLVGSKTVLASGLSVGNSYPALLNQQQPSPEDKLILKARFPTLRDRAGVTFAFDIELKWEGSGVRKFDLAITQAPPKWQTKILQPSGREISAITLEGSSSFPDSLSVIVAPLTDFLPEPGKYVFLLEASSGDIKQTVELTAEVTAQYLFAFYTETGLLNTQVTAGERNHLALMVANTGTAEIEDITFTSSKPSGWTVTFNPESITSLAPGLGQPIDVIIEPPSKTIAGDYLLDMTSIVGKGLIPSQKLEIRVTVLTPTIWGWVGILIVLAVIGGLGIMFRVLGRR